MLQSTGTLVRPCFLQLPCYVGALHYNPRSRSSHIASKELWALFFNINITVWCGSNDIRELTKFSTQLDMLIEEPRFKGKVHICADGGTMQDGRLRSVSFPSYTLMAAIFFSLLFFLKFDTY